MPQTPDRPRGFLAAIPPMELERLQSRLATFLRLDADVDDEYALGMLEVSTALANGDPAEAAVMFTAIAAHKDRLTLLNAELAHNAEALAAILSRNIPKRPAA